MNLSSLKKNCLGEKTLHLPNIEDEKGVEGVPGINRYLLRMMSPLGAGDIAVMPSETKTDNEDLFYYFDQCSIERISSDMIFYVDQRIGETLSMSTLREIDGLNKFVRAHKNSITFSPFIHGSYSDSIALGLGFERPFPQVKPSELVNDKYFSQIELGRLGVSVPEGKLVNSRLEAVEFYKSLIDKGYEKVSFKLTRSCSGVGVFQVNSIEDLERLTEEFNSELLEKGILMDGWIKGQKIASPNIQYAIKDSFEEDVFIACSDQILDGLSHKGNISDFEILNRNSKLRLDCDKIRNWVRETGYRGVIGIDFYIADVDGQEKAYYMETNARINGSTPGAMLVNKITGKSTDQIDWGVQNGVKFPKNFGLNEILGKLERNKLIYDPSTKTGAILTNHSTVREHGKAMFTVIGKTSAEVKEILEGLYCL